jgi:hypothetical protein
LHLCALLDSLVGFAPSSLLLYLSRPTLVIRDVREIAFRH